jgi:heme oxygenase (mycobilin-producing)
MSVVRINAITVPADSGDELARRFAARAGAVDDRDGFEGFELLKPTDGRTTPAFGQGHRGASSEGGGAGAGGEGHGAGQGPVGVSSELWSFDIAGGSAGAAGS